ncbi:MULTISPECIES: sensor histidine kinase [Gammaproteobacteria]|uniref:sensor histidine kinase n=1 Tax=Gammaproteobacteria TaxID=1236 RepID=UPI000DCFCD72|nr:MULTISPECIES: histidine kinase [Gammaproteobacteria]RTE85734.1 transcriptional regulator [Aliidiomarina sp. B3213]TCZ90264.1 transcriptional regulator [Lysobacter sp. N42]
MIDSKYYRFYQAGGWFAMYSLIVGSLYLTPAFNALEFFFAFVLLATAGLYSHGMRFGYKQWVNSAPFWVQGLYFLVNAIVGSSLAALVLFSVVYIFSLMGIVDALVPGQIHFVFQHIFWGNAINMFIALVLWSAFYLITIKARAVRDTGEALASSQLEALVQQLNPHFLFNMMNNIRALILEDPEKARLALAQLADMLRYSLKQHESREVTVTEELEIVSEYVDLCRIQFEDRLQFETEISESLLAARVPRMLLQLCVENAIKHGISKRSEGGTISIAMRELEGQWLEIFVTNPCPASSSLSPAGASEKDKTTRIGLRNIRERLNLLYKQTEVRLSFKPVSEGYAMAETYIVIPLLFSEDNISP